MPDKDQDAALREAARARGFRLVKSRRRKPGGDFGRYGLVGLDSGRECLGFGADGLTATSEEVHAYLRGGEVASWKRSLIGVVGEGPKEAPKRASKDAAKKTSNAARPERSRGTTSETGELQERAIPSPSAKPLREARAAKALPPGSSPESVEGEGRSPPSPAGEKAEPQPLTIREATRRDAAALAKLTQIPAATLAERLAAANRNGEPPLVATRGGALVGLAAWTILSTLHEGPRGRITLLLVVEGERRQGVGTALLAAVEQHLAEAGITATELLLDIDFDAPTAFLRRTGWTRTTNGYGKTVA